MKKMTATQAADRAGHSVPLVSDRGLAQLEGRKWLFESVTG